VLISLDTTLPVSEGINEIFPLLEAVALVIVVVFIFLRTGARR
jgi:multidrug efflux pump subunit AcrB